MLPPSQSVPNQLMAYDSLAPTQDRKPLLPIQVSLLPPTLPSLQILRKAMKVLADQSQSIRIHILASIGNGQAPRSPALHIYRNLET